MVKPLSIIRPALKIGTGKTKIFSLFQDLRKIMKKRRRGAACPRLPQRTHRHVRAASRREVASRRVGHKEIRVSESFCVSPMFLVRATHGVSCKSTFCTLVGKGTHLYCVKGKYQTFAPFPDFCKKSIVRDLHMAFLVLVKYKIGAQSFAPLQISVAHLLGKRYIEGDSYIMPNLLK
ncbi:hypothetical protein NSTC745_01348 [Nostoc sp. DSM 114161]|jgi:hypothetical protein